MKTLAGLTLIALLAIAAFPLPAAGSMPGPTIGGVPTATAGRVVLVAGQLVDLKWDPAQYPDPKGQPFLRWELWRGLTKTSLSRTSSGTSNDFYRDKDNLTDDTTYFYELRVIRWNQAESKEESYLVFDDQATTGTLGGTLHLDLTLGTGEVDGAYGGVDVLPGVELIIGSGTTITGGRLRTNGGRIQIDGSTFKGTEITYGDPNDAASSGTGWLRNPEFEGGSIYIFGQTANLRVEGITGYLGSVAVSGGASAILERNEGDFNISVGEGSSAIIRNNPLIGGAIWVDGAGTSATITSNEFWNESCRATVSVSGGASATIAGNDIAAYGSCDYHMGVVTESEATATVSHNSLVYVDNTGEVDYCATCYMITVRDHAKLTVEHNKVENGAMAVYGGAEVKAIGNVIRDGWLTVGAPFLDAPSHAFGRIERNTFQDGGGLTVAGGEAFPALNIEHNCIQGTGVGLSVLHSTPAKLINNWWGDDSGPMHPVRNPNGLGRRIEGDAAIFDPWDKLPTYCLIEPEPLRDLQAAGIEVVQVIQDDLNSVPLVAGKPTAVRVYAHYRGSGSHKVKGVVKGYRDGKELSTPQVLVGRITARELSTAAQWDAARRNKYYALTYRLPDDWLSGSVTIKAEVSLDPPQDELITDNNNDETTVSFFDQNKLTVGLVPIRYQPDPAVPAKTPASAKLPVLVEFMRKTFPHSKIEPKLLPAMTWTTKMTGLSLHDYNTNGNALIRQLTATYRNQAKQIVGILDSSISIPYCQSDPLWLQGSGVTAFCGENSTVIGHEIGHNLGLIHPCLEANKADCGGAFHTPPPAFDWPHTDTTIQEYGINLRERDFGIVQNHLKDMMTQGFFGVWISPHHYQKLFNANGVPQNPSSSVRALAPAAQPYLLASGWVQKSGSASFLPFWQVTASEPPFNPPVGSDYCLELRGGGEALLSSRCFDLSFYNYELSAATEQDLFLVALPLAPGTARVVLRQGSIELESLAVSEHPPQVTLLAPNGGDSLSGSTEVRWSATDQDLDGLAYSLSYSTDDGATWLPVVFELTGTMTHTLDLAGLPGGTACRVRIEATDGFHTASDQSDAPFGVPDKAPTAYIHLPEDGDTLYAPPNLLGYGYDLEDGALEGSDLAWSSDLDGPLGSGDTLWDADLSPGEHTLILSVTDSQAQTGTASIKITILEGSTIFIPWVRR